MTKFNLTDNEIDVILDLIESRLDEVSVGLEEVYKDDISIMEKLKIKLLENN